MDIMLLFDLLKFHGIEQCRGEQQPPDDDARYAAPFPQWEKQYHTRDQQDRVDVAVPFKVTNACLVNCLFHDFDISFNQCVKGDVKQITQHQQAVDVRIAFVVFPGGDRLPCHI